MSKAIVWFRDDLRLIDNEAFSEAIEKHEEVYPVFFFDPHDFGNSAIGTPRMGAYRAQFLIESVLDLRKSLKKYGGDLMVFLANPEHKLPEIATKLKADVVYAGKSVIPDQVDKENKIEQKLWKEGMVLKLFWQSTLYHQNDIPWPIKHLPEVFTDYRKELEMETKVRPQVDLLPKVGHVLRYEASDEIPSLSMLGLNEPQIDKRGVMEFQGGEKAAWKRLKQYFWETDQLASYKETRNGMVGADYSSKLSPWLAVGAISPKSIYYEIKRYEKERVKNDSTYWLYFELLWRDYFKFIAKKHGVNLFDIQGIRNRELEYFDDFELFERWAYGETGEPFVDANMKELNATGFMSNRGRQNVASYLVNDLKINWTWGAYYFQSLLIDYDPCSNWGNWNYIAGVGNDPRQGRVFNIQSQAERYDPEREFINRWMEEPNL